MITNKFENLYSLQRKINTRALLPDARPSRPILAVKKALTFKPWGCNSSTYRPTGLLYPGELILPRTLCQLTVYWHPQDHGVPGPKKCLYKRSSLFLPSKESLECALKRALWLLLYSRWTTKYEYIWSLIQMCFVDQQTTLSWSPHQLIPIHTGLSLSLDRNMIARHC